jgi:hypothetical protein
VGLFDSLKKMFGEAPPGPATPAPSPTGGATGNVPPVDYEDSRIPEGARERVRRVLACLHEVERMMDREQVQAVNRAELELMRSEHLPKLVRSYIDIPPSHRAEIFRKTGKSASFILDESLDKLQTRIDEIMKNLAQHDIDTFTNNVAFIGRRYSDQNPFS